jgi:hypothetical protein
MEKTLERTTPMIGRITFNRIWRGLGWGCLGGLSGTLVMDLLLMGALLVIGQPAVLCFSIVGDTVSRFLAMFGRQVAGGIPAGMATHYIIGPLFGVLFGALVTGWDALRLTSVRKCVLFAVLYVEILSQPILITTPILLKMKTPATLQWFGGSFVMHLIMSIVLGVIVGCGMGVASQATQRKA